MSPTPRAALLLAAAAATVLVLPPLLALFAVLALGVAIVVDALAVREAPEIGRKLPDVMARGTPASLEVAASSSTAAAVRVRQPLPPDLQASSSEGDGRIVARLVARRRGRHIVPGAHTRSDGPLRLGRWFHAGERSDEVLVYPDLPSARKIAQAVREGRFREPGRFTRGPLGLGTDFESVRDYLPDDDIRQVNWRATARLARPMSNQYRVEQDREVVCVVDCGRLMAGPLDDGTRLDAAIDAASAVALVADQVGDRSGTIAFDAALRRRVRPRRRGATTVVGALFDLEPSGEDSDYELAFRLVEEAKRSFVLVLTDLLEEAAAAPLLDAMPILARRHWVVVASASDTDLEALATTSPRSAYDVYATSVALEVLDARARVATLLARAGAEVVQAPARALAAECVGAYLRAKRRGRL